MRSPTRHLRTCVEGVVRHHQLRTRPAAQSGAKTPIARVLEAREQSTKRRAAGTHGAAAAADPLSMALGHAPAAVSPAPPSAADAGGRATKADGDVDMAPADTSGRMTLEAMLA